jgi:hypothetical protein
MEKGCETAFRSLDALRRRTRTLDSLRIYIRDALAFALERFDDAY